MGWWLLLVLPVGLVLGYGWAALELLVSERLGWLVVAAIVAACLVLGRAAA
jgi:hypothetical protein